MAWPTEAKIVHEAKPTDQPSLLKTLRQIRTLPEIHDADRRPKPWK